LIIYKEKVRIKFTILRCVKSQKKNTSQLSRGGSPQLGKTVFVNNYI